MDAEPREAFDTLLMPLFPSPPVLSSPPSKGVASRLRTQ